MNNYKKLLGQVRNYLFGLLVAGNILVVAVLVVILKASDAEEPLIIATAILLASICASIIIATVAVRRVMEPLRLLQDAILHVSPERRGTAAPDLEKAHTLGKELLTSLTMQVYQIASSVNPTDKTNNAVSLAPVIANNLPVPMFVMDKTSTIIFANDAAAKYLKRPASEIVGQNLYSILDLSFPTDDTFDHWLDDCRANKATDSHTWEHAHLKLPDEKKTLQLDISAHFSKGDSAQAETILTLFDRTASYTQDEQGVNFVALAVHELRGPLTLLRGYIDVFEEELDGKLTPELTDFMNKMQVSGQQLTTFVNNILNVSRLEADQLVLQLSEQKWEDIVKGAVADLNLRAQVHGKSIECDFAPNLPMAGVDRVSIYEVLSNLLDNAIKYSDKGQKIYVKSVLTKEGVIETTVQDTGVGIPTNVLPNLFEKFYRSHRTQSQVGGTGLGLYLSKAIIEAHSGHIWIRSKEGEGTTVGFTIQPYVMVAHKLKSSDNNDIVRGAHGWIKNHSLYRR